MPIWSLWGSDNAISNGLAILIAGNLLLLLVGAVLGFAAIMNSIELSRGFLRVIAMAATLYHLLVTLLVAIPAIISFHNHINDPTLLVHVMAVVGFPAIIGFALWSQLILKGNKQKKSQRLSS